MCGTCGLTRYGGLVSDDEAAVHRMAAAMRHRGPDGDGFLLAPGVALGVRRLRIIDLATGDQPIYRRSGKHSGLNVYS